MKNTRYKKLQGGAKRMDSPIFKSGDYNFNLIASI